MKIYSVYDKAFKSYGQIIPNYDTAPLLDAMRKIPMPAGGVSYEASIPSLEACAIFGELSGRAYGGLPAELGMCWGYNTRLNCLEYHRDSELNIAEDELILLLAKREEIEDGVLDTAKVKAFRLPAGAVVEIYATTLHFAPCHLDARKGFRMAVVLPRGTNLARPEIAVRNDEDRMLFAANKWLLAHPEAKEASQGAWIGLKGTNIDIAAED